MLIRNSVLRVTLCTAITASTAMAGDTVVAAFDDGPPEKWAATIGEWKVKDGVLVGRELDKDDHPAAGRLLIPIQDGTITFRFRAVDAKAVNFGFDPARGKLKKRGHLFAVKVTPTKATLTLAPDKNNPKDRSQAMATASVDAPLGEWREVRITLDGDSARVVLGSSTLSASHPQFKVKKTGLVLRVMGGTAEFDDIRIQPKYSARGHQ